MVLVQQTTNIRRYSGAKDCTLSLISYYIEMIMFLSNRLYSGLLWDGKEVKKQLEWLLFVNFFAHSEIMSLTALWTQLSLYFLHQKIANVCLSYKCRSANKCILQIYTYVSTIYVFEQY